MGKPKKAKPLKAHNLTAMVVCEECGVRCLRKDATQYDPFVEEVYGDREPKVLCPDCNEKYCEDI